MLEVACKVCLTKSSQLWATIWPACISIPHSSKAELQHIIGLPMVDVIAAMAAVVCGREDHLETQCFLEVGGWQCITLPEAVLVIALHITMGQVTFTCCIRWSGAAWRSSNCFVTSCPGTMSLRLNTRAIIQRRAEQCTHWDGVAAVVVDELGAKENICYGSPLRLEAPSCA